MIIDYERNNLTVLGGFTNKLYFNLLRILPFVGRLGDLLERESLITDSQERKEIELLSHQIGSAFKEIKNSIEPVFSIYENIKLGPNPGQSTIVESQPKPEKNKPPGMDLNSILSDMAKPENMKNMMNMVGSLLDNKKGGNGGAPDFGKLLGAMGPLVDKMMGGEPSGLKLGANKNEVIV